MGITNEDLKYIHETSTNTFRVSVPNPYGKRLTKVEHDLVDAIHTKYDFLKEVKEQERKVIEENLTKEEARGVITKYSTVQEGIELYLKERYDDMLRGFIQTGTYDQDILDTRKNPYLKDSKIFNEVIKNVDDNKAQEFINYLFDLKSKDGKRLSENTIYKPYSFVRKLFNYFKDELKIINYNPFDNCKNKPVAKAKNKDYFTEDELHYVHDMIEFENIRFRTFIIIMMDLGLRKEEAVAIKFSDINVLRKTLSITRAFIQSRLDGKYIVKKTKTEASIREVVLTNHALELIGKLRKFKENCGFVVKDDDYVFTAWDSLDLISPSRFTEEFRKFLKKINCPKKIPLKNLRTSNTSFYVARGQNLKAIQRHAGHSSFDTTMTYYAQSNLNEERKLVNIYEEEFYNKLGLSFPDLYRIVTNRFDDTKKIINILEKVCNTYIDETNYNENLERCQEYFKELFPIFNKIQKIDNLLDDDELDSLLIGFTSKYLSISIEPLPPLEKSIRI